MRAKGREYQARRRAEDPEYAEKGRERIRTLWAENPECQKEVQRRSYAKHAEKRRAESAAYKAANPDRVKEWNARRDPERLREQAREWGRANPELRRERYRQWAKNNPEAKRAGDHRYRARKVQADGHFTGAQFAELCEFFDGCCFYCDERRPLTADHMMPLTRGGSNWIENIAPACFSCNSQKGTKTVDEYLAYLAKHGRAAA